METSPNEAVKNNVGGTLNVATAADKFGVKRFVMISTDKAVNPTNIMGATKRICEMIIQQMNKKSNTEFVAVRFGNVLGSNGSVIPRFREQIINGGPVTVTHKDIIRFFMTIPEACRLVLEAATMGEGYEIFVFDMGKPVKIADLARNMISLAGFEPDKDIKIVYTGLRPGEKLYEELLSNKENTIPTGHRKISVAKDFFWRGDTSPRSDCRSFLRRRLRATRLKQNFCGKRFFWRGDKSPRSDRRRGDRCCGPLFLIC
jgi:FlaA1/EpsC-like NDP-sugar epimerase